MKTIVLSQLCGLTATTLLLGLFANTALALSIKFDYSYDTHGFFTDLTTGEALAERRALMDHAASYYSGFTDQLTAINPQAGDSWSVTIGHPSLRGPNITLTNTQIEANTITIYVGGSAVPPGVLGMADTGFNLTVSGSEEFTAAVNNRGQSSGTDYGTWGGRIWFNAGNDWYFGEDPAGLTTGKPDFLTTAIHEIGHILGFGEADSWFSQVSEDGYFIGDNAMAAYGGAVPLGPYGAHWAEGVYSYVDGVAQETLMDPSTPAGQRQLLTDLDYAGFVDMGWEYTPVPAPPAFVLLLSALSCLPFLQRHRNHRR